MTRSAKAALAALVFFVGSACVFIPKIGLEEDEVLFVPGIYNPRLTSAAKLGEHAWPMMVIDYVGADKLYLYTPIVKWLPANVWTLRIPMVLAGALSLWLLFGAVRRLTNGATAAALTWLIATDPMYLLTTTFDWGPVALQHLFVIAAFALLARPDPRVFAGFVALGLALWDKGTAIWILAAFAISLVLCAARAARPHLNGRNAARALGGFVLGALPFIAFNIRFHWATFANNAHFTGFDAPLKLRAMWAMLNGRGLFDYLVRGGTPGWYVLAPAGLALAVALVFHRKVTAVRRTALFALSTGFFTWLGMLFAQNGGSSAHHIILIWPWPQMFALCILGAVLSRKPFVALVAVIVISNVVMTGWYAKKAIEFGPGQTWSEATLRLPEILPQSGQVAAIDWGIANITTYLTRGRLRVFDIAFNGIETSGIGDVENTVFLSHVPGEEMSPGANARFDAAIAKLGYTRGEGQVIPDSRGRPVLVAFHCVRRAP